MATKPIASLSPPNPIPGLKIYRWANLTLNDDGAILELPYLADKTVQVYGTFGASGKVVIQGSNKISDYVWTTLSNPQGDPLDFTTSKIQQILENPFVIRPIVTDGDGTTDLEVIILCRG